MRDKFVEMNPAVCLPFDYRWVLTPNNYNPNMGVRGEFFVGAETSPEGYNNAYK